MVLLKSLLDLYPKLHVVNVVNNKGKANALKQGLLASKGELIATIDSEAMLDKDALNHIVPHFITPNNGGKSWRCHRQFINQKPAKPACKFQLVEYASIIGSRMITI